MTKMAAKWLKLIPYWSKRLKKNTHWGRTYLYSPYKGVFPRVQLGEKTNKVEWDPIVTELKAKYSSSPDLWKLKNAILDCFLCFTRKWVKSDTSLIKVSPPQKETIGKELYANEYMKDHILELRRKIHRNYTHNLSSCEIKAWKKFRPERDSNPWPLRYRPCSALPTQAIWEVVTSWLRNIPVECEWCKWIYIWKIIYLNCGERYDFMIDHRRQLKQLWN